MLSFLQGHMLTVLVSSVVFCSFMFFWYSDFMFKQRLMKLNPKGKSVKGNELLAVYLLHILFSIILVSALCIIINVFTASKMSLYAKGGFEKMFAWILTDTNADNSLICSLKAAVFLWIGVIFPVTIGGVLWKHTTLEEFFIHKGGNLIGLLLAAATISYLS